MGTKQTQRCQRLFSDEAPFAKWALKGVEEPAKGGAGESRGAERRENQEMPGSRKPRGSKGKRSA